MEFSLGATGGTTMKEFSLAVLTITPEHLNLLSEFAIQAVRQGIRFRVSPNPNTFGIFIQTTDEDYQRVKAQLGASLNYKF
jgi:hypothetical protein